MQILIVIMNLRKRAPATIQNTKMIQQQNRMDKFVVVIKKTEKVCCLHAPQNNCILSWKTHKNFTPTKNLKQTSSKCQYT